MSLNKWQSIGELGLSTSPLDCFLVEKRRVSPSPKEGQNPRTIHPKLMLQSLTLQWVKQVRGLQNTQKTKRHATKILLPTPNASASLSSHGAVQAAQLCPTLWPHGLHSPWNSPGQNTGVDSFSLLRGIFPTQGANLGLPHYRKIFYQLSHKGSPRILEWVAYPFSSGSSRPRNQTGVSYTAGGFFTNWAMREAPSSHKANTIIRFTCTLLPQVEAFVLLLHYLFCTKVPYYIYIAPCFFHFTVFLRNDSIVTYINWSHYFKNYSLVTEEKSLKDSILTAFIHKLWFQFKFKV